MSTWLPLIVLPILFAGCAGLKPEQSARLNEAQRLADEVTRPWGGQGVRLAVWLICVGALTGCTPEDAATRLSRECISLVDLVLKDKQTVQKEDLARELKQRGVSAPIEPIDPFSKPNPAPRSDDKASLEKWLRDNADRNAKWLTEQTAYEAWWRDIKEHAAYSPAWDAAFARKRNTAIQRCIEAGAAKQGVTIR